MKHTASVVPGTYKDEGSVVIELTETIPQPDVARKRELRVKDARAEIAGIDRDVAALLARKVALESALGSVAPEVAKSYDAAGKAAAN